MDTDRVTLYIEYDFYTGYSLTEKPWGDGSRTPSVTMSLELYRAYQDYQKLAEKWEGQLDEWADAWWDDEHAAEKARSHE